VKRTTKYHQLLPLLLSLPLPLLLNRLSTTNIAQCQQKSTLISAITTKLITKETASEFPSKHTA